MSADDDRDECPSCGCPNRCYEGFVENVRAFIRMAFPDDMTPSAKRLLEQIIERHSDGSPDA